MILHATKAGVKKVTNECNAVRHGMEVNAISNERKNGRRTNVRARSANRKVGEVHVLHVFGSPFAFGSHDAP